MAPAGQERDGEIAAADPQALRLEGKAGRSGGRRAGLHQVLRVVEAGDLGLGQRPPVGSGVGSRAAGIAVVRVDTTGRRVAPDDEVGAVQEGAGVADGPDVAQGLAVVDAAEALGVAPVEGVVGGGRRGVEGVVGLDVDQGAGRHRMLAAGVDEEVVAPQLVDVAGDALAAVLEVSGVEGEPEAALVGVVDRHVAAGDGSRRAAAGAAAGAVQRLAHAVAAQARHRVAGVAVLDPVEER